LSEKVGVSTGISDLKEKSVSFGGGRCLMGIAGKTNSDAGYLTSIYFKHGDTLGDGENTDLILVPRESENTVAERNGCGESIYYNKTPSLL
jgi:hypothetical protein